MNYEFNIRAKRKDFDLEVNVRVMEANQMPKDGITYYCEKGGQIYEESELSFFVNEAGK